MSLNIKSTYTHVYKGLLFKRLDSPGRRRGGGDLHEIPFVVGVWIFSGTTHWPRGFSLHSSQLVVEVTVGNNTMANRTTIA